MNENSIKLLRQNKVFKTLTSNLVYNRVNLSRDISGCGDYTDDPNTCSNSKCFIEQTNLTKELISDLGNNKIKEVKPVKKTIKLEKPIKIPIIYPVQNNISQVFKENDMVLSVYEIFNRRFGDNLLYIFLAAMLTNFVNNTEKNKETIINNLCKELSFNLTHNNVFDRFSYKGIIKINDIQNILLDDKLKFSLPYHCISTFLSDCFNVNIVTIVNKLLIKSAHHLDTRLNLVVFYKNKKYILISNNIGNNLMTSQILNKIIEKIEKPVTITKLSPISKYKISDLHEICESLGIPITYIDSNGGGKEKKKTKSVLYEAILELLPR